MDEFFSKFATKVENVVRVTKPSIYKIYKRMIGLKESENVGYLKNYGKNKNSYLKSISLQYYLCGQFDSPNVALFRESRNRGFKHAPEPFNANENDKRTILTLSY